MQQIYKIKVNKPGVGWTFMLFLWFLFFSASAFAQSEHIRITIYKKSISVIDALKEVEKQAGLSVGYNESQLKNKLVTNLNLENETLKGALEEILKGTGYSYQLKGKYIIIVPLDNPEQSFTVRHVEGKVSDTNGEPLIGVNVLVKGTEDGGITDLNGKYKLSTKKNNPVLVFSYIGYKKQEIPLKGQTLLNVTLSDDTQVVDEVVVTALGIKRSEKALSYSVSMIKADDITANKDVNFINSLNGKVPGVTINSSSGGVGSSSKVLIRGQKSISQSSNALYVIDGVPMLTVAGEGSSEFGSSGATDPIADINPEDIESISVLNGATAAALYGSDAANGAILVTTKTGQTDKTVVTVTSNVDWMQAVSTPNFQNRYGTGDLNSSEGSKTRSWGNRLNAASYMGYEPVKDYLQTGVTATETVALSTGTEKKQTYLSMGATNSKGIVPNNKYDRYNFTFRNTTAFLEGKMKLDVGASYIYQKDRNMINQGVYGNPLVGAYLFPRGNDWEDISMYERYDFSRNLYTQYWPVGDAGIVMENPYWINYRELRQNNKSRYMLNASLSYDIWDWLNVSGRIRMDNSYTDYSEKNYASTNTQRTENSLNGFYGINKIQNKQLYGDVMLNINKYFGDNWSIQANIGASLSDMRQDANLTAGPIPDGIITDEKALLPNFFAVQNLSNTAITTRRQEGWHEQTQSVFASAEIGYKHAYYLTLTGRNDWPSQLAGPHSGKSSFFYPSVGGSVILSEIFNLPEQIDYLKLRASWASVGVAFERYIANPLYGWSASSLSWSTQTEYPVYDLKPERTNSMEVGVTLNFLKHFNIEFTYYNTNTKDQTFDPSVSVGSGSSSFKIQSGNVRNRGFELSLGYNNVWSGFSWSTHYTLSANRNKILSLANNVVDPSTGKAISINMLDMKGLGNAHFILKEGGTLGDLYSVVDLKRDTNGDFYIDENGKIASQTISNSDDFIKLGSVLPKASMAWRNDFQYAGFNLGLVISARLGGIVFSRTQAMLDYYGVSETSAVARDNGGVVLNGSDLIDANTWYTAIAGGDVVPQYYTYSATNVRLQEATFGYTFPKKWLGNVCDLQMSVVARNLFFLYKKAPFDPESIATTGNFYSGIDYFMTPSMRNVGFNIRLKF